MFWLRNKKIIFWFALLKLFKYFLGYEDFVDIFWGHHKIGLYLGVISKHLGSFLKVKVHNGGYFWGLLKFQIFLGAEIPDIFGG